MQQFSNLIRYNIDFFDFVPSLYIFLNHSLFKRLLQVSEPEQAFISAAYILMISDLMPL